MVRGHMVIPGEVMTAGIFQGIIPGQPKRVGHSTEARHTHILQQSNHVAVMEDSPPFLIYSESTSFLWKAGGFFFVYISCMLYLMNSKEFNITNEVGLDSVVQYIQALIQNSPKSETGIVLALSGDLGAGKTTFTKLFAKSLDVKETLTSPTFVILKKYQILNPKFTANFNNLIHIDAYRLEDSKELQKLSFDSFYRNPNERNIICIEWPEIVPEIIPNDAIQMRFEHQEGTARKVTVNSNL